MWHQDWPSYLWPVFLSITTGIVWLLLQWRVSLIVTLHKKITLPIWAPMLQPLVRPSQRSIPVAVWPPILSLPSCHVRNILSYKDYPQYLNQVWTLDNDNMVTQAYPLWSISSSRLFGCFLFFCFFCVSKLHSLASIQIRFSLSFLQLCLPLHL